jgi:hypothetical protein
MIGPSIIAGAVKDSLEMSGSLSDMLVKNHSDEGLLPSLVNEVCGRYHQITDCDVVEVIEAILEGDGLDVVWEDPNNRSVVLQLIGAVVASAAEIVVAARLLADKASCMSVVMEELVDVQVQQNGFINQSDIALYAIGSLAIDDDTAHFVTEMSQNEKSIGSAVQRAILEGILDVNLDDVVHDIEGFVAELLEEE